MRFKKYFLTFGADNDINDSHIMLAQFTFQNFMSFSGEADFSMVAANSVKEMGTDTKYSNVVKIEEADTKLVKVAAIYGANASGKSNIIHAMMFFRSMVLYSVQNENLIKSSSNARFMFNTEGQNEPLSFEIIFFHEGVQYRYGFEIKDEKIDSEWLFKKEYTTTRESYCFIRENGNIKVNTKTFKGAGRLEQKTRDNALFISIAAQFNVDVAMKVVNWFETKLHIIVAPDMPMQFTARKLMTDEWMRKNVIDFIHLIDLGIEDLNVKESAFEFPSDADQRVKNISMEILKMINQGNNIKQLEISATHLLYEKEKITGTRSLPFELESLGTNKIFSLLGPWFECLRNGGTLFVDEFGASLHTHLAKEMIRLFQSSMNTKGAQLVITTHDTNLLRRDLLRRDQIWFVEKDKQGQSDLYSLVEYKINQAQSVRNDASYQKDYLVGKYGAIPYFGNIEQFIADYDDGIQE